MLDSGFVGAWRSLVAHQSGGLVVVGSNPAAPTNIRGRYHRGVGPTIVDAKAALRYEARDEGDLAGFIDYVVKGDRLALIHTEVLPSHQGRGIADQLVRFALDDARQRGLRVIAICAFVRRYVERHPETQDIVVGMPPA